MLELEPLRRDQYKQVAEWEYGPQPDGMDWERHARDLEQPNRLNYAVYSDGKFCAAICYEQMSPTLVSVHVSKEPHTIHPHELGRLLIHTADYFFQHGIEELQAIVPAGYRPSRRLAIRTGMTYRGNVEQGERFAITKDEYYRLHYVEQEARGGEDAVSTAAAERQYLRYDVYRRQPRSEVVSLNPA